MAKLKPWYQVVTPREDLRDNRPLDASEFAIHLDQIRDGRAPRDYIEPNRFFERTHVTGSLLDLASQTIRRLSGIQVETSAVFNMSTQFGGGKSHSLTALYHLAKHGDAAKNWKGVSQILERAGVPNIPQAAFAVFMGKEFDSLNGRGGGDEPVRKTPWGEIAWQLGGAESLAVLEQHEREFIEPKGDAIRAMLPKDKPALILFDEVISYVSTYRQRGYGNKLYNFLDCLAETARGQKNVVVVASIPASDLEYNEADTSDEMRFKKMLDRLGKAIMMSADTEMAEIIRRRLFEWQGLSDDARKTVAAYAEWAAEHASELTGITPDTAYEVFAACYPFHPSVLSVFERKWQSLPRFQRTRGILRLLALWVSHNFNEEHRKVTGEPLITLGLAPLQDKTFRSALFEQLGDDTLEVPVTADIAGKSNAHGMRLDAEANDSIRKAQLHRKVATTIFFESNGGTMQANADASVTEIKAAVGSPDQNIVEIEYALEGLASNCFYLNWDRNRYRFGLLPNLNKILVTRRGSVKPKARAERIRKRTEELFRKNSSEQCKFVEREFFPKQSSDVKELPRITLVVMSLDFPAEDRASLALMESIARDYGTSGRTFKSALIFAVADANENVSDRAGEVLAWEDIEDDEETKKGIDEAQLNLLKRNLKTAQRDLDEAIFRAYKHLYLLDKQNKLRHIDLGNITSSAAGSLVEAYLQRLGSSGGLDEIVESVPARRLAHYWPASLNEWSTKAVRDAFYSSPLLPRLLNPDQIKRMIADGVAGGLIGYATKDAAGRLKLEKLKETLIDSDVEISDDVFILKSEDAQKLREPPRLARLVLRPEHVNVRVGDQAAFTCAGIDQYEQPIGTAQVAWSASGGTIDAGGLFTAGEHGGVFSVKAVCEGHEEFAEVRVTTASEPVPPPVPVPGERFIRWRGVVPPQKWMNFYTKVLSKYATSSELKLEVSFEVKVDSEQADAKASETKSALRELGLDDGLTA